MRKAMKIGRIVCLSLLLASLLALLPVGPVLAQEEEKIELEPTYGKLEDTAPGASFEFEVGLTYLGSEDREFDLSTSGPEGWLTYVQPNYGTQRIGSIRLESVSSERVKVAASPPFFVTPEPGEYEVIWNGKDQQGKEVTSGVYLARLSIGQSYQVKKLILIR